MTWLKRFFYLLLVVCAVLLCALVAIQIRDYEPESLPNGVQSTSTPITPVETPPPSQTQSEVPLPPVELPSATLNPIICEPDVVNPNCWNTEPDIEGGVNSPGNGAELIDINVSTDVVCGIDRLDLRVGTKSQIWVDGQYVPGKVIREGYGAPVEFRSQPGATLKLVIHAMPTPTTHMFDTSPLFEGSASNWAALREIQYAGSFEGQTSLAIGLDHQVRFAVMYGPVNEAAGFRDVVVYFAHD